MKTTNEREIVSFKGTRQGILMSIAEDEIFGKAMESLRYKVETNDKFFSEACVSLDLGWRELDEDDLSELLGYFQEKRIKLLGIISSSLNTRRICEARGLKVIIGRLGLADHHGNKSRVIRKARPVREEEEEETPDNDDPPPVKVESSAPETVMIRKTIRSGQSVSHEGNMIIAGDVNPGAEAKAGGDLVILGALRGVAYAGTKRSADDPIITAFKFQPTQITIGENMVSKFERKITNSKQPVTARLKGGKIEFSIYG